MKLAFYKKLSRWGKVGFFLFLIINASFIFLLLSPIIPNLIGQYRDDQLLAECNDRIQQYRTTFIEIKLENSTDGTPIEGWNVSFDLIKHEFIFGCNIYAFDSLGNATLNEAYRNYFKNLFNFAVLPFYWKAYEPDEGNFVVEPWTNDTIDWCIQNNITLKGHPLVWTRSYGIPDWLPLDNDSLMLETIENRITSLVYKYRDTIEYWDVVNEPVHTETFAQLSRLDHVLLPLEWANATNPSADLTVNDYGLLGHDFGNGPFYQLLSDLKSANAPFDSIGMQAHEPRTDWIPATEIWNTLEAYSKLGKSIYITEFTPVSAPVPITNSWKKGMWSEAAQAEYARCFYTICFSHPSVKGVIWWDLTDAASWLEGGGLLRSDLTPKLVYTTLDQLINMQWDSFGSQISNSTGGIHFQGFYGLYNVSVQNGAYNFLCSVESGKSNQIVLTI
jgi:endo-1,4-beta-xylanase